MKLKSIATIIILTTLSIGIFAQKVTEIVSDEPMMTLGTGGNEKYPYWFRSENGGKLFRSNIVQTDKKDLNSFKLFFSELDLTTNRLRNVYTTGKFPRMPIAVTDNFIYFAEYPNAQFVTSEENKRYRNNQTIKRRFRFFRSKFNFQSFLCL
jgi:hypothetical protein